MKKTMWLLVVVFLMAGGMYTYIFFAGQKETRASISNSYCPEVTVTDNQVGSVKNPCSNICSEVISSCPSITTTTPPPKSTLDEESTNFSCDNCVCGTDEECPNEEKCDECLDEDKLKQAQPDNQQNKGKRDGSGNGSGNGNNGKNRNERK